MKNKLSDLRNHLFESLEILKDAKYTSLEAEIKRANAVRQIAQSIIETAKVEVGVRKLLKTQPASDFFNVPELATEEAPKQLGEGEKNDRRT